MLNIILIFLACFNFGYVFANQPMQSKMQPIKIQAKKFVIVTASYNNIDFVGKYLEFVFSQKCDERKFTFRVIYYDDCSDDGTGEFVEAYKKKFNLENKLSLIRNETRVGGHENIYNAIHSCDNDEIVLIVDGDDWLARDDVLEFLDRIYSDPDVWITYGQFRKYPNNKIGRCREIPHEVIESNSFRSYKWVSSHLRTFYAWLYKRIKKEDIMFEGKFVPMCGDLAIMFPMLEMAGTHSRFIPEVLYIYNCDNQNSYWRNLARKRKIIRAKFKQQNKLGVVNRYSSRKTKCNLKNLSDVKKTNEIHDVIERYIRQDIAPYMPLQERDLVKS